MAQINDLILRTHPVASRYLLQFPELLVLDGTPLLALSLDRGLNVNQEAWVVYGAASGSAEYWLKYLLFDIEGKYNPEMLGTYQRHDVILVYEARLNASEFTPWREAMQKLRLPAADTDSVRQTTAGGVMTVRWFPGEHDKEARTFAYDDALLEKSLSSLIDYFEIVIDLKANN